MTDYHYTDDPAGGIPGVLCEESFGPPAPPCYECGRESTSSAEGPGGEVLPLCSPCASSYIGRMPWIVSIETHGYVPWQPAPPPPGAELPQLEAKTHRTVQVIECEVYSRVSGYFRPVSGWNAGKRQEFEDRHPVRLLERYWFQDRKPVRLRAPPVDRRLWPWYFLDPYYSARRAGRIGHRP